MNRKALEQLVDTHWPARIVSTTAELAAAGIGDRILTAGVRFGVLTRLRRGAFIRAGIWLPASARQQDLYRLDAHVLTSGAACTYSHFTAALIWRCRPWPPVPGIHLSSASSFRSARTGRDVVGHRALIAPDEVRGAVHRTGIRIELTSLERTVVDCARVGEFGSAVVVGDQALRRGADLGRMNQLLEQPGFSRGIRRARRVLAALDGRSESAGETRTRLLIAGWPVPQPVLQLEIVTSAGTFRPDFAWPDLMLILEFDGKGKYFDYRPTGEALYEERRRERILMEQGWRFLRIEWADLDRPDELRRRLQAAMLAGGLG